MITQVKTWFFLSSCSRRGQTGQIGQSVAVMISYLYNALYLPSIFHIFLQSFDQDWSMPNPTVEQLADTGLAYSLDESLTQDPLSPRNGTAPSSKPITRLRAISILLDKHEDDIFHYLEFARCNSSLSHEQYLAVCALKDCSDTEVRTWLKRARKLCKTLGYLLND